MQKWWSCDIHAVSNISCTARVAVHFNAVCDRFSPYDTIFEIDSAKMLTDTKLSAACSLHTASGSTSSTSSSRKKRLVEIVEEDEDELPPSKRKSIVQDTESPVSPTWDAEPVTLNSDLASSPENSKFSAPTTSEVPDFVGIADRPDTADSMDDESALDYSSLGYLSKPKIKLGPRPSVDSVSRPQTAGNFRPVSAIPAGYKLFGKGKRNKSKDNSLPSSPQDEIASLDFASPSIASSEALALDDDTMRPTSSSGLSVNKKISPEKARLMKAMKLREKKKQQQQQQQQLQAAAATQSPAETPQAERDAPETTEEGEEEVVQAADDEPNADETDLTTSTADSTAPLDVMSSSTHTELTSDLANSEPEASTNASSVSESTEETVQAKDETAADETSELEAPNPAQQGSEPVADDDSDKTVPATDGLKPAAQGTAEPTTANENVDDSEEAATLPISRFSVANLGDLQAAASTVAAEETETESWETTKKEPPHINFENPTAKDLLAAAHAAAQPVVVTPSIELTKSPFGVPEDATTESVEVVPGEAPKVEPPVPSIGSDSETVSAVSPTKLKREGVVLPINTASIAGLAASTDDVQAEQSSAATTDEVNSASVSDAPVTPITPIDSQPAITEQQQASATVRTISNPVRGNGIPHADVSQSSARSVSMGAGYLHKITQQAGGNNLSSKSNVGSSISQRIKALERLSANNAPESRPTSKERPQSTFFSVKKREPSNSPSVVERTNSLRNNTTPSPTGSQETTPEAARPSRDRSGSMANRLSIFQPTDPSYSPTSGRPETISVMAKIVRDGLQDTTNDTHRDSSTFNSLDLKQSPLFVSHQKADVQPRVSTVEMPPPPPPERTESQDSVKDDKSRRMSLSLVKGFMKDRQKSPTQGTSDETSETSGNHSGLAHRPSISSRSSFSRERDTMRSPTSGRESPSVADNNRSPSGDNRMSRAGRFMKRLSTLSGSRSKGSISGPTGLNGLSPTPEGSPASKAGAERPSTTGTSPWIVSYLGDVNVQFPDSLLWKRRNLCLDSQGFLVLSALPAQSSRAAQGTKRYHLSEFKQPYTPEVEMQELPNSVVLDFVEGTSLQLACEDRTGQMNVLNGKPFKPPILTMRLTRRKPVIHEAHGNHGEAFGQ